MINSFSFASGEAPLRDVLARIPELVRDLPSDMDIRDPAYICRWGFVDGRFAFEIGYSSDRWRISSPTPVCS